jgi:hypothetical protein
MTFGTISTTDGSTYVERMRITSGGQVTIQTPTSGVALLANGKANEWTIQGEASSTSGQSYGLKIQASTTTSDVAILIVDKANTSTYFRIRGGDAYTQAQGVYNNTSGSGANVVVTSDGGIQRSTSSLKYKKDVENAWYGLSDVMKLRAVTYKSKNKRDGDLVFGGLIAEEVHESGLTEFVQYAEDGSPDALSYGNMVSLLVKAVQEQQLQIEELKSKLN